MDYPAKHYNIKLASKSPRRQQLLRGIELDFEVWSMDVDETYPDTLLRQEIPLYLARLKSDAFMPRLKANDLLITADTIVWLENKALNKPQDASEALRMLQSLCGKIHEVYTAVCMRTLEKEELLWDMTRVHFAELNTDELNHYIEHYKPFDKAGAYGAQDWIGLVGIDRLEGSYFNVMGLPVHKVYKALKTF